MSVLSYVVFVFVSVVAFLLGGVGAYFYYRARHHESTVSLEALQQDLSERETELHRLQNEITDAYEGSGSRAPADEKTELSRLRRELEQKKNDYDILKQDFDVEIGILRQEVEQFKGRKAELEQSQRTQELRDADPGVPGMPDEALRARESKLVERAQELAARTQELNGRERELATVAQALAERERVLADIKLDLAAREQALAGREQELAARAQQLTAREGHLDEEIASRRDAFEQSLADREKRIQAGLASIENDQEVLARARAELSERESRLDDEFLAIPEEKFTSRQEAVLIKRLKHQNKLQRSELEQVRLRYHRMQRTNGAPANASESSLRSSFSDDEGDSSPSVNLPTLSAKSPRIDDQGAEDTRMEAAQPAGGNQDQTE